MLGQAWLKLLGWAPKADGGTPSPGLSILRSSPSGIRLLHSMFFLCVSPCSAMTVLQLGTSCSVCQPCAEHEGHTELSSTRARAPVAQSWALRLREAPSPGKVAWLSDGKHLPLFQSLESVHCVPLPAFQHSAGSH